MVSNDVLPETMAERLVLFVCVGNAARSLMAEAIFNAHPPAGWRAMSAGTKPAAAANPRTAPLLVELGVAPPTHPPSLLTPEMAAAAEKRVTMGCLDDASCPIHLKSLPLEDWALPDPKDLDDAGFRRVRDAIVVRVEALRSELARGDRAPPVGPPVAG
ncbi:MAG TPA: low molecular weight phosphatase family protein [Thermoplasmata archaeon]|nr:low molecular weight phosphatase family protein [Thermoplasmata archaeon]